MSPIEGFVFAVLAGSFGSILHEGVHWLVAHAVGAQQVGFEWGGWLSKTFVTYELPSGSRASMVAINLAPQALTAALAVWLVATQGLPTATFSWLAAISFLAGLGVFGGREDYKSVVA